MGNNVMLYSSDVIMPPTEDYQHQAKYSNKNQDLPSVNNVMLHSSDVIMPPTEDHQHPAEYSNKECVDSAEAKRQHHEELQIIHYFSCIITILLFDNYIRNHIISLLHRVIKYKI